MTSVARRITAAVLVTAFIAVVVTTYMASLPEPGSAQRYLAMPLESTGASNRVSGIYLNVRLFDTLLEVLVFSVAVLGVRHYLQHATDVQLPTLSESAVVRTAAELLGPLALLLSSFFVLFGHLSPGGGFAGGVIAASAVLYLAIAQGMQITESRLNPQRIAFVEKAILLILLFWVLTPTALGRVPMLDLLPKGVPGRLFSGGAIMPYNILIGLKVFFGTWLIVSAFAQHRGEI